VDPGNPDALGPDGRPDQPGPAPAAQACVIASRALGLRGDGGADPALLRFSDVTVVVDAFKLASSEDGQLYAPSHQGRLLRQFFDLLDFARREGIAGELSPRFVRHPGYHAIKRADDNEDEIGKAIPEAVIRQLDQHLHLLGKGFPYGDMPPDAVTAMFQAIYVVLRDTGRRPAEVAGLDLDCLERDQGEYQLVWHNMKGGRLRRRLPVVQATADAIMDWKEARAGLNLPGNCAAHLFPAVTGSYQHMDSGYISRAIRLWADSIPVLESGDPGRDGTPLPFDRSKVFPCAFRHTFCQRYADAGIALHVLQALMDHRSADTTSAYYQVSKKMKREAVNTLRVLAVDRTGAPAPIGSAAAYEMRSVAVPWGNCTEPSNVKAGGAACPIRWQCPGCSHYRPDPSHLPAIEDQARSLTASLETASAIGAAHYTIAGIEGEIAGYAKVTAAMKARMDGMPRAERREVEEASKILRRLRAGAAAPGPVPTAHARRQASGAHRVTGKRSPADVLLEARKKDSLAKRSRVLAVIDEMKARNERSPSSASPAPPGYRTGSSTRKASASTSRPPARDRPAGRHASNGPGPRPAPPAWPPTSRSRGPSSAAPATSGTGSRPRSSVASAIRSPRPAPPSSPPGSRTMPPGWNGKTPSSPRPAPR
jgi:integrase